MSSVGLGSRKVTFSQVVDQLACSLSDSSSLSDISCSEEFRQNVNGSSKNHSRNRNRKMYKPTRSASIRKVLFLYKIYIFYLNQDTLSLDILIFSFRRVRTKKPFHGSSFHGYVGGTSGSEDVCESSMESIESYNNISLKHLTGLSLGPQPASPRQAANIRNKMSKISSADSLLSMIRNLASSKMSISSPSSPQLSDNGDMASSGKKSLHYCQIRCL